MSSIEISSAVLALSDKSLIQMGVSDVMSGDAYPIMLSDETRSSMDRTVIRRIRQTILDRTYYELSRMKFDCESSDFQLVLRNMNSLASIYSEGLIGNFLFTPWILGMGVRMGLLMKDYNTVLSMSDRIVMAATSLYTFVRTGYDVYNLDSMKFIPGNLEWNVRLVYSLFSTSMVDRKRNGDVYGLAAWFLTKGGIEKLTLDDLTQLYYAVRDIRIPAEEWPSQVLLRKFPNVLIQEVE
jgi:hypothetical protein